MADPKNIDEYIAEFPEDVQAVLAKVRATIRKAAPDAEEAIKYRIPTFVMNGNLVHFAAFKNHLGFYPAPSAIEKFARELSAYEGAKGSVRFPLDQPMPLALIEKVVKFRVQEQQASASKTTKSTKSRNGAREAGGATRAKAAKANKSSRST